MITLTEDERAFLQTQVIERFQNAYFRSIEGPVLETIIPKLTSTEVEFTETESLNIQTVLQYFKEGQARLTDQRLQHVLMEQNNQGFGRDHGSKQNWFHSGKQYLLAQSILGKLVGS